MQVKERLHLELRKALHRAQTAECIVEDRDYEIKMLREELKKMDEEKYQITTKLQADVVFLQNENDCCYHEVKNAMDQLAGIDGGLPLEQQKRSNFDSYLGKQRRKHAREVKERVNFQDERSLSKVDFSLEEVGMTLHCKGNDKSKAPKAVSMEVEQHLKRLTSYVRNLEACIQQGGVNSGFERRIHSQQQSVMHNVDLSDPVDPVTVCFQTSGSMQVTKTNEMSQSGSYSAAGAKKSSYYLQGGCELNLPHDSTQKLATLKQQPSFYQNQKVITWSQSQSQERITAVTTANTPGKFTNLLSRCISWKWRWAAAASQLKTLSKELQIMSLAKENKTLGVPNSQSSENRDKFFTSMQKLGFIHVQNLQNSYVSKGRTVTTKSKHKEAKFSVSGHKVISIMLSMWRASIKNAKLEKEAVCNGEKLSRLLAGLPWLIQKFEERRHLERMFYHWVLHMLRSKVQIYHTWMHQSSSWSAWQRRPPSSLWVAQLGLADSRTLEGNGYEGRYLRYSQSRPIERQQPLAETRTSSSRSPERSDFAVNHQDCANKSLSVLGADICLDGLPSESSGLSRKDTGLFIDFNKNLTAAALNPPSSDKSAAAPDANSAEDTNWNKKQSVTTFTEKAMQALQVSLYNDLQKLQDLIVKEARFHQEKVGVREERHEDDGGSNASPFSTSLWRICNGLAHCLIEARNQILALAGNSESKICQTTASKCKPYPKLKNSTSPQTMTNKSSDKTCQKTRFRFLRSESKGKKQKSASRDIDLPLQQEAGDAEIFEFVGAGSANRHMAQGVEVDSPPKNGFTHIFLPTSVGKLNEIGLGHESFSELKT
ncbi:hypothetical protein L7F22_006642 [Adiantum nelumboides]|nr:hypothetical protein [Adiantum nelumboides]